MIIWAAAAFVLVAVSIHDLVRKPTLRRVALRNLTRRVGEASLVIFGSALGTAIIAGALIVGDTFDNSIRDIARTDLGPVDQIVSFSTERELERGVEAVRGDEPIAGVDGVAGVGFTTVAMTAAGPDPAGEPRVGLAEGDFDELRAMGPEISGLADAGATPSDDDIVLMDDVAGELDVEPGDGVVVYAYGQEATFTVRDVLPQVGLVGFGESYVAPGTLARLAAGAASSDASPPVGLLLVSNTGGVFDSIDDVDRILAETASRLRAAGLDVDDNDTKRDLLEDAEAEGDEISSIFTAVGGFSVLAGVLLLVNLFVMLAEERKVALGVLRAIGWRRNHLVRGFVLEGAAYASIAGVLGALSGIAVGWVIVQVTQGIFAGSESDFDLRLAIEPRSLVTAGLVGLVISMVVIWGASLRISRLNIIRAIRDLPEPPHERTGLLRLSLSVVGVAAGLVLSFGLGLGSDSPMALISGVPLALFSALPLARRLLPERAASVAVGLGAIVWSVVVFTAFADVMEDPPIPVFLIQGVAMVAGAVTVSSSLAEGWSHAAARLPGGADTSTQLGLAYPLARRFRTGASIAMFSLIVFSMTFIAVLTSAFGRQISTFVDESAAGYDAQVSSNPANPIAPDQLDTDADVAEYSTVLQGWVDFSAPFEDGSYEDPNGWRVSGIDSGFTRLGEAPALGARADGFADDVAVFDTIATDPTAVVVSTWFLGDDDEGEPAIGDTIDLVNAAGARHALTIIGIMDDDWTFGGAFVSADLVRSHLPGEYAARLHYVSFVDGLDPEAAVASMEGRYVQQGAEAETFTKLVSRDVEEQQGFFNLLSGYLALGLLIGVAGLGVVMVRAVRERRSQVGTLRAMGMSAAAIRRMFLTEGSFVALQGVLAGLILGLISAYQLLTQANTFEVQLGFSIPWLFVVVIITLPLLASALAAIIPARRAAAIPPAVALRLTD